MTDFKLHHGDCLDVLRTLPDNSIDAVITDPPYGLSDHKPAEVTACLSAWIAGEVYQPKGKGFMGKSWDSWVPGPEVWRECLRVLKPGGHMLTFAGTRSMDLMSMAIRLAGFELRDSIGYAHDGGGAPLLAWTFGSGFPKSLDVSKAIDKTNGETGRLHKFTAYMRTTGLTAQKINEATGTFMGSHYLTSKSQPAIPTRELWAKLRPLCSNVPEWADDLVERIEAEREVVGIAKGAGSSNTNSLGKFNSEYNLTLHSTEAAKQWEGWGSALKPAWEPILLARKPLTGTIAENVLEWGVGALNIDATRIPTSDRLGGGSNSPSADYTGKHEGWKRPCMDDADALSKMAERRQASTARSEELGRWPANLITDGSQAVLDLFPSDKQGSAARYFYCAKASKADREEGLDGFETKQTHNRKPDGKSKMEFSGQVPRANNHPTVKPLQLMQYLCRLITPPGGTILDPFTGSGSTGKAAMREGFRFVGIEREEEYLNIARARIEAAVVRKNRTTVTARRANDL